MLIQKTIEVTQLRCGTGLLSILILFHGGIVARAQSRGPERIEFNRDIRPILSNACFKCHGPDASKRKAELRLDQRDAALSKGNKQPVFVPGKPLESEAFLRMTSTDSSERMPPTDSGRTLTKSEIALIRKWIEQGAEWQQHWSFIAPQRSRLPKVQDESWPRNAIDYYILARLEIEGLKPSTRANKRTLIRRLSFDLTGLPPTPREIAAFHSDKSPGAYDKLVDRLLASPRYGERMALDWLDAARYADTHGYHEDYHRDMWPWRDWVINALNTNMPFDQFTIEQLAGDLLPAATNGQIVATGFNRNHGVTASGISEEYRVEYVLDRVRTTSTVWLGLTLQCAQCHDHKYDPISQEDFYRFFAYFNTITDKGVENRAGNVDPLVRVTSPAIDEQFAAINQHVAKLESAKKKRASEIDPDLIAWEKKLLANGIPQFESPQDLILHYPMDAETGDRVTNVVAEIGHGTIKGNVDRTTGRFSRAVRFDGKTHVDLGDTAAFERTDTFSYGAWVLRQGDGAIIARMDDSAAYRGWDVYVAGGQVEVHIIHRWPENAIHMKTKQPLKSGKWTHLFVTYDGSSKAAGSHVYFDGQPQAVDVTRDALTNSIKTDKPLHIGRRNPSGYFQGTIDDVRIYDRELTKAEVATLAGANPIAPILAIKKGDRTKEQNASIRQYFLDNHDVAYRRFSSELDQSRARAKQLSERAAKLTLMVMQEMKEPRSTFILQRGQYDQPGRKVDVGTPRFLPPLPNGSSANRLGLANWLVSPDHPLTARVAVNRLWQLAFGMGFVKTSENFGTQGEMPSHPKLLDWLATEFIRIGWDAKQLLKLIVTSATYQQSSKIPPELLIRDPQNRFLARGPRFRLPAELIRDNALAVSGLLVHQLGGPSVKTYQPRGLWRETSNRGYEQDHSAKLYRRSLYTYWKRSVPPPSMFAIDAPTRETCTVRRQRTNTPLMALVMLNDPTFVEAARKFAERAMTEAGDGQQDRIGFMFELATARRPEPAEHSVLRSIYKRQHAVFTNDTDAALKLLAVGESKRNEVLDVAKLAAWTTIANVIMNMDETITKE